MNAFQRLLLGISAGGLATLLAFPTTRAYLFHPFHRQALRATFHSHSLSYHLDNTDPVRIPPHAKELPPEERFLRTSLIARQLALHPGNVTEEDYNLALRFLAECWQLDPDNAFWPQLISAVHIRCRQVQAGEEPWSIAGTLSRWNPGIIPQLESLWADLARTESQKMSWQGFATLRFRNDDPLKLIQAVPQALLKALSEKENTESTKIRVVTIANANLIRSGASSLTTVTKAIDMALYAIGAQTEDLNPQNIARLERLRGTFENQVNKLFGPQQRIRTQRDLETLLTSRFHLMDPRDVQNTQRKTFLQTLAVTALPSATLLTGIAFGILWALGALIRANLGSIPHPDARLVALSGILLAIVVFISRAPWMLAIWVALLGILLALPMEIAKPGPVTWSTRSRMVLNSVLVVGTLFALTWLILGSPAGEHLPLPVSSSENPGGNSFATPLENPSLFHPIQEAPRWRYLFIFTLSLSVVFAVAWSRVKTQPVFLVLGEAWAYIGLNGMLLSLTVCVALTPVCLFIDRNLQATAQTWITNEPLAFEVG